MSTGVVAALVAEARTLGPATPRDDGLSSLRDGTLIAVSGMGGTAAAAAAAALLDAGATSLVSWGLAGGHDPALPAGTICLPSVVSSRAGAGFDTDRHWREMLGAALADRYPVTFGRVLTSVGPIDDIAAKAAAFRETGAAAVDMESAAIAEVAASRSLPFIAVRVVVDTAADTLPAAVVAAGSAGQVNLLRLLQGLVRAPRDILPLVRLGLRYRTAIRALTAAARTGALASQVFAAAAVTRSA